MKKVSYNISGFDCANCALNVEQHLNSLKEIKSARIDYINNKMVVVYRNSPFSIEQLKKEIRKIEDDDIVIEPYQFITSQKNKIIDNHIIALIIRSIFSVLILIITFFFVQRIVEKNYSWQWWLMLALYLASYLIISYDYLLKFLKNLLKPKYIFNENTLMVVASIGAFAIGEFPEGILVILLSQIGEMFEHISVNKSKNIIVDAIDTRPKVATIIVDDKIKTINVGQIKINDRILIKVGEIAPVDGKLIDESCIVDESSITGEFAPRTVMEGEIVYSGSIIKQKAISIEAVSTYEDSTTSKILSLVLDSSQKKSKADAFVSKFAKVYTPIVCLVALLIAIIPPVILGIIDNAWQWNTWSNYIHIALTFLVISCPCAIVISVPLSFFTGIALASKKGIVVKGSNYLDKINDIKTMVFDKTGTLTTGQFSIVKEEPINLSLDDMREYLFVGESLSSHPIGQAIKALYNLSITHQKVYKFEEISGYGLKFQYRNHSVVIGNEKLMEREKISFKSCSEDGTIIYLAIDENYCGFIILDDTIKSNSAQMVNCLSADGINSVILSGGKESSVRRTANLLNIKEFHSNLLPQEKINYLENIIHNSKHAVGFVGDGVNDSPSIIMADVGFAMGAVGSDAAVENADVVIMNDDPIKIVEVKQIARLTRTRSIVDIVVALVVKFSLMVIALLPFVNLPMWVAVLADSGLAVILVFYSVMLINKKIKV